MASMMQERPVAGTVALIRWPSDAEARWALERTGRPRLLVIERDEPVPRMLGPLEDWVLEGADPCEISLRAETLAARCSDLGDQRPVIEPGDVLRYRGGWVALSPAEVKALHLLLDHLDHCVSRNELEAHTGAKAGSSALNSLVKRLRHRLAPLGLTVSTVHARGYVLSTDPTPWAPAPALRHG